MLLCATFVFASYAQWQLFTTEDEATFVVSYWNPISLTITHGQCINGESAYKSGVMNYPNLPFLLFWVSTIANLFFLVKVMRDKEKSK